VTVDFGQPCPACGSSSTYWTFSTVDGDAWDCGNCGHQWTITVDEQETAGEGVTTRKDGLIVSDGRLAGPPGHECLVLM
jgi:hypothetical protein